MVTKLTSDDFPSIFCQLGCESFAKNRPSKKDSSFFNRFSALGTVTVFLIFFAVVYKAAGWGMNVDFSPAEIQHYVKTGFDKRGLVVLPGILSMAYFIHSAVTTLGKLPL